MKAIAVNGTHHTGKTCVCEAIIAGLRARGYSVGSVKEIHFEGFKIDPDETNNTNRHRLAGSQQVTARGVCETDILYQSKLPILQILSHYDYDYVVLEGVTDCNAPRILTANEDIQNATREVQERKDGRVVAVSGKVSNLGVKELCGLPVFHTFDDAQALVDLVEKVAYAPLPDFDPACCSCCGSSCREFAGKVAQGQAQREDCVLERQAVELTVDGVAVPMVPFVQAILGNAVRGVASELQGYNANGEICVRIKRKDS